MGVSDSDVQRMRLGRKEEIEGASLKVSIFLVKFLSNYVGDKRSYWLHFLIDNVGDHQTPSATQLVLQTHPPTLDSPSLSPTLFYFCGDDTM